MFIRIAFFITSRYHVHLIASLWGCKGIALSNNKHYDIKHASVKMMGSAWNTMTLDEAEGFCTDIGSAINVVDTAMANNAEVKSYFINKKLKEKVVIIKEIKNNNDKWFDLDITFDLVKVFNH